MKKKCASKICFKNIPGLHRKHFRKYTSRLLSPETGDQRENSQGIFQLAGDRGRANWFPKSFYFLARGWADHKQKQIMIDDKCVKIKMQPVLAGALCE